MSTPLPERRPVLTSHSCQMMLEHPSGDPHEPDWIIGRIQSLAIKASVESDAFWVVSAIQYNPDTKLNVMLEFYLIGIDFQVPTGGRPAWEFQQKITVRLKKESEIPYGFYWDDKRGRVDVRRLPQL